MPNIKGSVKRAKTDESARHANIAQKNKMRSAIKNVNTAKANNSENLDQLMSYAVQQIDKSKKHNLIHANKASRLKSQLMSN